MNDSRSPITPKLLRYGDVKADGWADVVVNEVLPYDGAERLCRRRLDRLWWCRCSDGRASFRHGARGAIIGDRYGMTKLMFDSTARRLIGAGGSIEKKTLSYV